MCCTDPRRQHDIADCARITTRHSKRRCFSHSAKCQFIVYTRRRVHGLTTLTLRAGSVRFRREGAAVYGPTVLTAMRS